jgi:hypothetical protein
VNDNLVSAADPDARVSQKPGKVTALNHLGIISVDTAHHVICGATADFADIGDAATVEKLSVKPLTIFKQPICAWKKFWRIPVTAKALLTIILKNSISQPASLLTVRINP